ncbi:Sm-like ribonucleoprotein [Polychytrium aggregatum]|uniref:Sm-like ribonucleoprotein n=1 Tax=Polychytrium aggregatum TaxID=110093 RepID=UPI0022FDC4F4|nr:Sm-like ribonucleoprotein [Polychytrium aggregatum]KAI9208228.1 Sm-like ribonucleoprotein [Polychytrium aggregatum]
MDNFLPGSASLVDCVDKRLLVILRDGRKLIGYLRSYDQFANLVLQDTVERTYNGDSFGDTPHGIFVIRGENVVLLGEIDPEKEALSHSSLRQVSGPEAIYYQKQELDRKKKLDHSKNKVLHEEKGFSVDTVEHDHY